MARSRQATPAITMGKKADFGPFTPIVILTRIVIGEKRFNGVLQPTMVTIYRLGIGGVDRIDNFCAEYRRRIFGKKWY